MNHSIQISPELYQVLQQRAVALNATVEALVESAVRLQYSRTSAASLPQTKPPPQVNVANPLVAAEELPPALATELDQLAFLRDDELWRAARTALRADEQSRMDLLLHKQQATGLTATELAEAEALADRFDRVMIIRARAALLLQQRGHDITSLGPDRAVP